MKFVLLLTAFVVFLGHAPDLHAQTQKFSTKPGRPGAGSLGFAFGGRVTLTGDGQAKWADYPTINEVSAGSEAERLGIRAGDVILAVNGKDARDPRLLHDTKPGTRYVLRLLRGEEEREVTISVYVPEAKRSKAAPSSTRPLAPGGT